MKNTFTIVLFSILAFSCKNNDFENININFEFDKEMYRSNDSFELTIHIYPTDSEKTIALYKNLSNIEISFLSKVEQLGFHQELKKRFIEGPSLTGDDSEYIDEYTITKEKPYEKKLLGTISELENDIVFETVSYTHLTLPTKA